MAQQLTTPLTTIEHLRARTAIAEDALLAPPPQDTLAEEWRSAHRKDVHEDYWGRLILEFVEGRIGEASELFELWDAVNRHEALVGSSRGKKFAKRFDSTLGRALRKVSPNGDVALEQAFTFAWLYRGSEEQVSLANANLLRREIYTGLFERHVNEGTAIVDLGSGWGRYSTLLASRFPGARVFSGELSESGRKVTRLLSDRFDLGIHSFAFNYLDWSGLREVVEQAEADRWVVFSNHSMEQVTYVDGGMFEFLLDAAPDVRFLHVEPVGWQVASAGRESRCNAPKAALGPHGGYNKNLIWIVQDLLQRGRIQQLSVDVDHLAFGNPHNAGTKVEFRSLPA